MEKKCILIPLFLILFIFSVAMVSVGATIHHQKLVPFQLRSENCSLVRTETIQCPDHRWLQVWNGNTVESVFARRDTMSTVGFELNHTYPCRCHTQLTDNVGLECNVWKNVCYLDIEATAFVSEAQFIYRYGSDTLISIGTLLFVAICVGGVMMVIRSKRAADELVFVLTNDK